MRKPSLNPIRLGVVWQRLNGVMDEVAEAFVRTSFSIVVRENWDFACSLMDREGRHFAQSSRSIPSFIGTIPRTLKGILAKYPASSLEPGDVAISNDPWLGTGHLNDITMVQPIFRASELIGFVGSTFHSVDIGGAPSPHARDAYEEGLCIPVCKIVRRGEENADVIDFLKENLRVPQETLGDIRAQLAAYGLAREKLLRIMDEEEIDDLGAVTDDILNRSEASMRKVLSGIPDGEYADEITTDGFDVPLTIRATVRKQSTAIEVDYAGTSPQVDKPINSVMNYTYAYSAYAVKCALDPQAPNNEGSFRPLRITAPEGCLVNPVRPAPVWGRHLTGHYLPFVILSALAKIIPERVVADSGSPLWSVYFKGADRDGRNFVKMFFMNGGHGARSTSDGPACLSFPSNISNTPVERFENEVPLLVTEKELIADSGGAGQFRGGPGQRLSFKAVGERPIGFVIRHERVKHPPRGLLGGLAGAAGRDLLNGKSIPAKVQMALNPGDTVTFETPGGGGMYPPAKRDPAKVADDVESGVVSPEKASALHGFVLPATAAE